MGFLPQERREVSLPRSRILSSELLQVRERVKGERLPLFVIRNEERTRKIAQMWRIPGTSIRVSAEGDIYYPVWQERSHIFKPELYFPCSRLPAGWTFERLLASGRRPISEVVFHQVKKDGGTVEVAIRNMNHILENYQEKGRELKQVEVVRHQIEQATQVIQETQGVSREEFAKGFETLYQQTLELMEVSGLRRARSVLKRDVDRLLKEASIGLDRIGRRNPMAMLKKLEAAARRIEYRSNETGFIIDKFAVMKTGLLAQRGKDRGILERARHDLSIGFASHKIFKYPGRGTTQKQRGILQGKVDGLIYCLEQTKVKGYKTTAIEATKKLREAKEMIKIKNYYEAKLVFQEVLEKVCRQLGNGVLEHNRVQEEMLR